MTTTGACRWAGSPESPGASLKPIPTPRTDRGTNPKLQVAALTPFPRVGTKPRCLSHHSRVPIYLVSYLRATRPLPAQIRGGIERRSGGSEAAERDGGEAGAAAGEEEPLHPGGQRRDRLRQGGGRVWSFWSDQANFQEIFSPFLFSSCAW